MNNQLPPESPDNITAFAQAWSRLFPPNMVRGTAEEPISLDDSPSPEPPRHVSNFNDPIEITSSDDDEIEILSRPPVALASVLPRRAIRSPTHPWAEASNRQGSVSPLPSPANASRRSVLVRSPSQSQVEAHEDLNSRASPSNSPPRGTDIELAIPERNRPSNSPSEARPQQEPPRSLSNVPRILEDDKSVTDYAISTQQEASEVSQDDEEDQIMQGSEGGHAKRDRVVRNNEPENENGDTNDVQHQEPVQSQDVSSIGTDSPPVARLRARKARLIHENHEPLPNDPILSPQDQTEIKYFTSILEACQKRMQDDHAETLLWALHDARRPIKIGHDFIDKGSPFVSSTCVAFTQAPVLGNGNATVQLFIGSVCIFQISKKCTD